MANLLEKANILITPTAYSDGKIHSAKPIQSLSAEKVVNGDFDTDTNWSKGSGWTISGGKANSDGSVGSNNLRQNNILIVGKTYKILITVSNYVSGSVQVSAGASPRGTMSDNGTYVFSQQATPTDDFFVISSSFNGSIDNISVKEIIDSDLNFTRGSAGTRVNAQGLVENSQGNSIPRINYKDGVGSWLIEPQSTNLITYSEDFSQWTAIGSPTIELNNIISPYGILNGTKLTRGSNPTPLRLSTSNILNTENTFTIYAKKGNYDKLELDIGDEGSFEFDLTNDWQRFDVTATPTTYNHVDISLPSSLSGDFIYIFGAQLEQSSYASSYIPTNGSVQTRLAETASRSGLGDLIDSTQGVFYAEISREKGNEDSLAISINDGGTTNAVSMYYFGVDSLYVDIFNSSGTVTLSALSIDTSISNKIAVKYKSGDSSLWLNGVEVSTNSEAISLVGLNELSFDYGNTTIPFYGNIKAVSVLPILTDQELECLTTR